MGPPCRAISVTYSVHRAAVAPSMARRDRLVEQCCASLRDRRSPILGAASAPDSTPRHAPPLLPSAPLFRPILDLVPKAAPLRQQSKGSRIVLRPPPWVTYSIHGAALSRHQCHVLHPW